MSRPTVTVIMPIRNEAAFISKSLSAVLNQQFPADDMEILIADGMSDDNTLAIIRQLPGHERVRIIPNPGRIQAIGLNLAIQEALGTYVIRVDGHTLIAQDYVQQCIRALEETGAANVGGPMNPVGLTPMGRAIAAAGKSAFAVPSTFHISMAAAYTDTVYMGAWPRAVLQQLGGYNEQLAVNEDYELNYRIRQAGGKIYFSPDIRSEYIGRQTLRSLAHQYFRYGSSKIKVLQEHPHSLRPRQIIAPVFVLGLVVGLCVAPFHRLFGRLWLAGIAAYTALNLLFSARAALRAGADVMVRIPLVFPIIHIAWGIGFWVALLRKLIRQRSLEGS
jgi:succinoglycan biosynthesis protein ExoA